MNSRSSLLCYLSLPLRFVFFVDKTATAEYSPLSYNCPSPVCYPTDKSSTNTPDTMVNPGGNNTAPGALRALACLALLACNTVVAFVGGPASTPRGFLTHVNSQQQQAISQAVSRAPGFFTPGADVLFTRARGGSLPATMAPTTSSQGMSMMAGAKKTVIITGASSGERALMYK